MKSHKKSITDESLKLEREICKKIRSLRTLKGISQDNLAIIVKITRQQLHLYETAQTKITAGKLFRIAQGLDINVASFFPDSLSQIEKLSDHELHLIVSFRGVGQQNEIKEKVIQINEIISQLIAPKAERR